MSPTMMIKLILVFTFLAPIHTDPIITQSAGVVRGYQGDDIILTWTFNETLPAMDIFNPKIEFFYNGFVGSFIIADLGFIAYADPYKDRTDYLRDNMMYGFRLHTVNSSDASGGNYTCRFTPMTGSNVQDNQGVIFLYGKPDSPEITSNTSDVMEGLPLSLICQASSNSIPAEHRTELQYTWRKNGGHLPLDGRHAVKGPGDHELVVYPVLRNDTLYSCMAQESGSVLQSDESPGFVVDVKYVPGKPQIGGTPGAPVIEGQKLEGVTCSLPTGEEGNPSIYTYHWMNRDSNYQLSSVNGSLPIASLNSSLHDGTWQCVVGNSAGNSSMTTFSLIVHASPVILTEIPPTVELIINETLVLECSFRARPVANIYWIFNGSEDLPQDLTVSTNMSTQGKYNITSSRVTWDQVSEEARKTMNGLYKCFANNSAGQMFSKETNLTVLYTPGQASAMIPFIDQVFEGTSVDLNCSVSDPGSPRWHQFNWMKDGVFVKDTPTGTNHIISLTVEDHDGLWACAAVNSVGEGQSANINVTVYANPAFHTALPPVVTPLAESESSLNISCIIRGKPPPVVKWDNSNLPLGVESVIESDTTVGKFTTVSRRLRWAEDSTLEQRRLTGKNYTCSGQILDEVITGSVVVDVQYGPYDTVIAHTGNLTKVENDTVTLLCTAKCNPICNYTWSFVSSKRQFGGLSRKSPRGQVGGELHFDAIKRYNQGWHICTASNSRGQDTKQEIYIAVHYPPDVFITIYPDGDLVQGMDATVLCAVDSRPPDNTITLANVTGEHPPIYDDSSNSTHSWITITDIDILDTGELRCTADNGVRGSPRSQPVNITVWGPVRVHQTYPSNNRTGAGVGDNVTFQVSIIARPIPFSGNWSWMFVPENLTVELTIPRGVELIVNQDLATLNISNVTAEHFGNYSLRTSNSYGGWELGDVVFELFAPGPPSRPRSFHAVRVTAVSITVEWMTGFDGGLPQTFTITYTNRDSGDEGEMSDIPDECLSEGCIMQRKITEDIADDAEYELRIRADNGKGQAMGDTITLFTPVRASLPQPPKISLGGAEAEITFSVFGQLTDLTIHHCVKNTENCKDDKFPILTLQQNIRGRRQARDTMYNFSQVIDLVDPSASSFVFTVVLYDGDDIIPETESLVIDRPGPNIGAIVGGVIGGLLLLTLIVVFVVFWRKGIIFRKDQIDHQAERQGDRHYENIGLPPVYNEIPADIIENSTYEDLNERKTMIESSGYMSMPKPSEHIIEGSYSTLMEVISESTVYRVTLAYTEVSHQINLPKKLVSKLIKDSRKYQIHQKYLEGTVDTMLKLVNCDNVINCLGLASSRREMLLEHVDFGSLRQYLTRVTDATYINSSRNHNRDLLHFIHQAANGAAAVAELEPEALFHCLSLDHVLLGVNFTIKLTGFSLAECVKAREVTEEEMGLPRPLRWLALEAIDLMHCSQSDVWSFGLLMWEIMNQGEIPFSEIPDIHIKSYIKKGCRLEKSDACTNDMYDLKQECWRLKPENRPQMSEVKAQLLQNTVYQNI